MNTLSGTPNLSIGDLFNRGWETFKAQPWFILGVFLVYSLINSLGSAWEDDPGMLTSFLRFIVFIVQGPLVAGTYFVALKLVRGEPVEFSEMFDGFKVFGKAFGVYVLYLIAFLIGLLLLVVPGIYVAVALWPAMYLVMDADLDVPSTLRRAWAMTEGHRMDLFLVGLALLGLNLLGLLMLCVGVIVTGAVSLLIGAAVYDELDRAYAG